MTASKANRRLVLPVVSSAFFLIVVDGGGTLGDRVGHKRMLVAGFALFGVASLVARLIRPA